MRSSRPCPRTIASPSPTVPTGAMSGRTTENVGKAIVDAFRSIEAANDSKLRGIFGDAAWTNKKRLPDHLLKDLIEHFSAETLSIANCPEDKLGRATSTSSRSLRTTGAHHQEFYTNRTVVHLMTEILQPSTGESIYDPTCGSAGMLISAIAHLKQHGKEWRNVHAYGQEINQLSSAMGRMNLFLHGVRTSRSPTMTRCGTPPSSKRGGCALSTSCTANPPYSIKQWDRESFASDPYGRNFLGTPPQGRADYAFIQHILKSMDPKSGRCVILLPHGVLFRNRGVGDAREAREKRSRRSGHRPRRKSILQLTHGGLLFSSAAARSAETPQRILFINTTAEVTRKNAQSYLEPHHIEKIVEAYRSDEDIECFSFHATIDEIERNAFSLSIPLYVKSPNDENADDRSIEETVEDWKTASIKAMSLLDGIAVKLRENDGE